MKHIIILLIVFSSSAVSAQSRNYGRSRSAPEPEQTSTKSEMSGFFLGLGVRNQTKTLYPETTDNVSVAPYETEVFYKDGASLEIGYSYMPVKSFGYTVGLSYSFPQKISRAIEAGQAINVSDTEVQVTDLILGTQYRDDRIYIPFGLVYSVLKILPYDGFSGTVDSKGGLGYQAGLGFRINDRVSLEALYRSTETSFTTTANGLTQNYGKGTLSYLTLIGKVYF